MFRHTLVPLALLLSIAGCDQVGSTADAGSDAPVTRVTYTEHVRPILTESCVGCHRSEGVAPFALDTYDLASSQASRIAATTAARTMPPFLADDSGECNHFVNSPVLSDAEIATLAAWSAQGAPEGDPSIPAPMPPQPRRLAGTTIDLDMGVDYVPQPEDRRSGDDYHCFIVEAPTDLPSYYVTGFDVRPGNTRIVHHVIVFSLLSEMAVPQVRALDEATPEPGYPCFGGSGAMAASILVAWAPGGDAVSFPAGRGIQQRGGLPMIVQMHYNATEAVAGQSDRSVVELEIRESGVLPMFFLPFGDTSLSLPPRSSNAEEVYTGSLQDLLSGQPMMGMGMGMMLPERLRVFGAFPHMHGLGRSLRVTQHDPTTNAESCLIDVPRWDYGWQYHYFFERPISLGLAQDMTIRCGYDTSSRDTETTWGEGTFDEMCVAGLFLSL